MKKIFLLLLLILGIQNIQAEKNPEARKVLEATERSFEKGGGIRASFTATSFAHGKAQGETTGTMCISGKKFQITTSEMITWFDGKTQWSYVKQNDEVNVSTPSSSELQSMNPYAFLNIYKKGFHYTVKNGSLRGKSVHTVHLLAENSHQDIQEILLDVEKGSYTPLCIRFRQKNNNWTRIVIKDFQNKQKFKNQDFTFRQEAYPQAEIIDMR